MQGRNVSFITSSIQLIHSQYDSSCHVMSIQYHIPWTVNTKFHRLDCQWKIEMSHSLHCKYNQYIVNTIYHALHCQYNITFVSYKISWIGLSMQGKNVSFITLPIQSMDSQYDISRLALSIQYHIQWTVNTIPHGLDCQCKVESSHCQNNQCIVNTIAHFMKCQYDITFRRLLIQIVWIGLSMQGRNVSYITLSIQSIYSQYNISRIALSIQYHIYKISWI